MWTIDDNPTGSTSNGTTYRATLQGGFGAAGARVPNALDRALALQALFALQGGSEYWFSAQDSLTFLLEFRVNGASGASWPLVRDGEAGGSGPVGDLTVTAEAVLALDRWEPLAGLFGFPAPELIDPDLLSVYGTLPIATQTGDLSGGLAAALVLGRSDALDPGRRPAGAGGALEGPGEVFRDPRADRWVEARTGSVARRTGPKN